MTFRELLYPMTAEEFFTHAYGKLAVHIPGHPQKFVNTFSWGEFNRLFNQPALWSARSMKMVLNGRDLQAAEFCSPGRNREGVETMLPDPTKVASYVQRGATLVLDLIERLSPGIVTLAASFEMIFGQLAVCNAYCSWRERQGFSSHFDTTDVFALHIDGEKTWNLYEGRFEDPIEGSGFEYTGLPPQQHEIAKGKLLKQVTMRPGDVLYIPRGQYHDAVAATEACLHVSFGLVPYTGHDFMTVLLRSLYAEPLFRQALPHFDDAEAYDVHLRTLADRLHQIITDAATGKRARENQRLRVLRDSLRAFRLPAREPASIYRVRWMQARLRIQEDSAVLTTASGAQRLPIEQVKAVEWILVRDYFDADDLAQAFSSMKPAELSTLTAMLIAVGLIEPL